MNAPKFPKLLHGKRVIPISGTPIDTPMCPSCGKQMTGIVDGRYAPVWRCVGCMHEQAALYASS